MNTTATLNPVDRTGHFLMVAKRQLHASPTNPRKEFPEASIEEMRLSVAAHGVIQPLIVRRWEEKDRAGEEAYEIVCGERRFRGGSRVEGLEDFPVIVRDLTDTQVREIQIIENLQREDVSPYDEAVGYAALLDLRGPEGEPLYSVERIAEKIGKVVNYVRNRLKMQRTPKALLEALRQGQVGTRICEMVGRIPAAEDRERCAAEVLEDLRYDRAMTLEETERHIREHYMIHLSRAPFDRASGDLVPKVGSCEGCAFRTGNDPELADELFSAGKGKGSKAGIDPQVCQNPKCFREKCAAYLARVKKDQPERVLTDEEAKAAFDDWGNLRHTAKLKPADRKPVYADVGHWDSGKLKSWGEYARKFGVPSRLVKNPKTGEVMTLVDPVLVKAAERATSPERPVFLQKGGGKEEGAQEKAAKEEKRRREVEGEEIRIAFDRLAGNLMGAMGRPEMLMILGQACDHQGIDVMLRWMDLKAGPQPKGREFVSARAHKIEAILAAVREDTVKYDREAILILTLMAQFSESVSYGGISTTRFKEFASVRGVDLKEVTKDAKAAVKARREAGKGGKAAPQAQGEGETVPLVPPVNGEPLSDDLTQMGAFLVNQHSVVTNPEVLKLVAVKKFTATAKMASIEGRVYVGWSFDSPKAGSSAPCSIDPLLEDFASGAEALDHVAYRAWSFFKGCEQNGEKVPAGVFSKLEEYQLKPQLAGQEEMEPVDPTQLLADDLATVVRHFGKVGGTASIDAVKISQQLGWPSDRAISAVNELRGRKMIVMGCLERDSEAVRAILAAMDGPTAAESSKLAHAAAARKRPGKDPMNATPSAGWLESPDLEKREKLLGTMMKTLKAWEPDTTIFDVAWMRAWVRGVKDDATARILLDEAVHRGAIPADSVVMVE